MQTFCSAAMLCNFFFSNCLKQARTSENNSSILACLLEVAEKLLHLHSRLENRFCTLSSLTRKKSDH